MKGWDDRVGVLPNCTFFHTSHWARILRESYQYEPIYLTTFRQNDFQTVVPLMRVDSCFTDRRGISLPFTDHCQWLINGYNDNLNFLDEVIAQTRTLNLKSLEVRGAGALLEDKPASVNYFGHSIELTQNTELLYSRFQNNVRRNIKKSEKEGVTVRIENSTEAMNDFYRLHCLTRRRHGLPPQPIRFFKNIQSSIISNNLGHIITGRFAGNVIAASMYFHFGDRVIYKFGASDMTYQHLRANNLVMWNAIVHYAQLGYQLLDLGKTEVQNEGLRKYKLAWGAYEKIISYHRYDLIKNKFVVAHTKEQGWYNHIFRKMPIPMLRLVGSILYKHAA